MPRYHVSADGVARVCEATPGNCRLKEAPHGEFSNASEAQRFAAEQMEETYGLFQEKSARAGARARKASFEDESHGDDFRLLNQEEVKASLLNPGTPVSFNIDGSLSGKPSGTLSDPIDLANITSDQAEAFLKTEGYSDDKIAKLREDFGDLSDRALITAATAELMTGPPQRHVRFSSDPADNYSFSMTNFEEVGLTIGLLQTDPNSGFIVPVKDPKASLSWMQVSSPANNVFQIQEHTGTNRLYMPQTANTKVKGAALNKLERIADIVEQGGKEGKTIADLAAESPELRSLQRELRVDNANLTDMRLGAYRNRKGESISREEYLQTVEVNGRDWMAADLQNEIGISSTEESYGAKQLSSMKPTQSGISVLQVQGMANGTINKFGKRIQAEKDSLDSMSPYARTERLQYLLDSSMGKATIVTKDDYILDGHHGLAKAALINSALSNGSIARRLSKLGITYDLPTEGHLPVVKLDMDGGQGFDAVTYWTEKNGFPVSGMK